MLMLFVLLLVLFVISFILYRAVQLNVSNVIYSCFECRFESSFRIVNYSLQFFTLALSFIAFDFEIFLVLPFIRSFFHPRFRCITMVRIVRLLTLLLYIEIKYITNNIH